MTEERSPESGDEFLPTLQEGYQQRRALNISENQDDQLLPRLLPGLPNEIVFEEIVPKLSWRVFHALLLVSRSWRQAIRSGQVYDARFRSHLNETLLVCNHKVKKTAEENEISDELSLYSGRDKSWFQLPSLPQHQRGLPDYSRFVSLDGKIYVLGGATECLAERYYSDSLRPCTDSKEVYVLDLVGPGEWKRCANMPEPRFDFLCGVINGKIYVFGENRDEIEDIQVYDPKGNAWSMVSAPSMQTMYFGIVRNVVTIGEELFLDLGIANYEQVSKAAEIYHPGKNEWRQDTDLQFFHEGGLFTAHGKLHRMTSSSIDIYHVNERIWERLHSLGSQLDTTVHVYVIVVTVNDELFVLAQCGFSEFRIFQGKGFGMEGKPIMWEELNCPFEKRSRRHVDRFMCTIQM